MFVEKCVELSALEALNKKRTSTLSEYLDPEFPVSEFIRQHLLTLLGDKSFIPCFGERKWQSLSQSNRPCLADADLDLAEKFVDKINIVMVNATKMSDFSERCRLDLEQIEPKLAFFWLDLMRLSRFSSLVMLDLENITESLMEAPAQVVQNTCRRLLPFIQCFLYSREECQPIYERLKALGIREKLETLKFYRCFFFVFQLNY